MRGAVTAAKAAAMGKAQAERPEVYEHADGSTYRGQWQGTAKHGFGSYRCAWLPMLQHQHPYLVVSICCLQVRKQCLL